MQDTLVQRRGKSARAAIVVLACVAALALGATAALANDSIRNQIGSALQEAGLPVPAFLAAPSAGGAPDFVSGVIADVPTQDTWEDKLNNTRTEFAGNIWTDKSVTADDRTVLEGGGNVAITVEKGDDALFLTDLSALASSVYIQSDSSSLSTKLPTTGGDAAVTFTDELGPYMEVKDIRGLFYGPSTRELDSDSVKALKAEHPAQLYAYTGTAEATLDNGDTEITYLFDQQVIPYYTVDNVNYENPGTVSLGATSADDATGIRVKVVKHVDPSRGDTVEVLMPARLLPIVQYEVLRDVNNIGEDFDRLFRTTTRPAHLFYSSGLKQSAVDLMEGMGAEQAKPEASQSADYRAFAEYAQENAGAEDGTAYVYNNRFEGASTGSVRNGTTTATIGISSANRYYHFVQDMPLYIIDDDADPDTPGLKRGGVYDNPGEAADPDEHVFIPATLLNTSKTGEAVDPGNIDDSTIDKSRLYYLPMFYTAPALGAEATLNDRFVRGDMKNLSATNPADAVNLSDVSATQDGSLYIRSGATENHHRGHLDLTKEEAATAKGTLGNPTETAENVFVGIVSGSTELGYIGTEYLGNNGRATISLPGTIAVQNTVTPGASGLEVDRSKEFTYTLKSLRASSSAGALLDDAKLTLAIYDGATAQGDAVSLRVNDAFTLKAGQTARITGVPAGSYFQIEQAGETGYAATVAAPGGESAGAAGQAVLASGDVPAGSESVAAFENARVATPKLVVATSEGALADDLVSASASLSGKELASVPGFTFALYPESAYDIETGRLNTEVDPLADGVSIREGGNAGRVVWTVREGSEAALTVTAATPADEPVRYFIAQVPSDDAAHAGIELSSAVYEAELTATDPDADGVLSTSVAYSKLASTGADDDPDGAALFKNRYVARTITAQTGDAPDGSLHLDVSQTMQGRDLKGEGLIRFILLDSDNHLLDVDGSRVVEDGSMITYNPENAAGYTDEQYQVYYVHALAVQADAAEGEASVLSYYLGAQVTTEDLPSAATSNSLPYGYLLPNSEGAYTAAVRVVQLQRYRDDQGAFRPLSDAGISNASDTVRAVTLKLQDDGAGTLVTSVDYQTGADGAKAAQFSNLYRPTYQTGSKSFNTNSFEGRIEGRDMVVSGAGADTFRFYMAATGDWACVSPLPGDMAENKSRFGVDDQWLYTPELGALPLNGESNGAVHESAYEDGVLRFKFKNAPFTADSMIEYELADDGTPKRDENGALVPAKGADGNVRHVAERTFSYEIREVRQAGYVNADDHAAGAVPVFGGVANGLAYDDTTIADIALTVVDDGMGHLSVSDRVIQVGSATEGQAATFTNRYSTSAQGTIPDVVTTVYGHDLATDQVTYEVAPVQAPAGAGMASATVAEAAAKAGIAEDGASMGSGDADRADSWNDAVGMFTASSRAALRDTLYFTSSDLVTGEGDERESVSQKRYAYKVARSQAALPTGYSPCDDQAHAIEASPTYYVTFDLADDGAGGLSVTRGIWKDAGSRGADVIGDEGCAIETGRLDFGAVYSADTGQSNGRAAETGSLYQVRMEGAPATGAGALTFEVALVDASNADVSADVALVHALAGYRGKNVGTIADGSTGAVKFYDGNGTGTNELKLAYTVAQLDELRHAAPSAVEKAPNAQGGATEYTVRYRVTETVTSASASMPSHNTRYFAVRIVDNGSGELTATADNLGDGTFVNRAGAAQTVLITGLVSVQGRPLDDGYDHFAFELVPQDGAPTRYAEPAESGSDGDSDGDSGDGGSVAAPSVVLYAGGNEDSSRNLGYVDGRYRVEFPALYFTNDDLGENGAAKTYHYVIRQIVPGSDAAQAALADRDDADARGNNLVAGDFESETGRTAALAYDMNASDTYADVYLRVVPGTSGTGPIVMRVAGPDATDAVSVDFSCTNVYKAPQGLTVNLSETVLPVRAELTGADLTAGMFTVSLTDRSTGEVAAESAVAADGSYAPTLRIDPVYDSFDNTYGHAYVYELRESGSDLPAVQHDRSVYRVTVNVTDDHEGHLQAPVALTVADEEAWSVVRTHDESGAALDIGSLAEVDRHDGITFHDRYNALGRANVTTSKRIEGRSLLESDQFTFELYYARRTEDGYTIVGYDPVASATSQPDGTVSLGTLLYSKQFLDDMPDAYRAQIDSSYALSDSVCHVLAGEDLDWWYAPAVDADAEGEGWTVHYVLKENTDDIDVGRGMKAPGYAYGIDVHLADDGQGMLSSQVSSYLLDDHSTNAFTLRSATPTVNRQVVNSYVPTELKSSPTSTIDDSTEGITVKVRTIGAGYQARSDDFQFEVVDATAQRNRLSAGFGAGDSATDADGAVTVESISLLALSEPFATASEYGYTYYLRQVIPDEPLPGIEYDRSMYQLRAVVTDGEEDGVPDGTLHVKWSVNVDGAWTDSVTFDNAYRSSSVSASPTSAQNAVPLSLSVQLSGRDIRGQEFDFDLYRASDWDAENGKPALNAKPVSSGQNRGSASMGGSNSSESPIALAALSEPLASQGEVHYVLVQRDNGVAGVSYDTAARGVTATVTDDGQGSLRVAWSVDRPADSAASPQVEAFSNVYAPDASSNEVSLPFTKVLTGRPWKSTDSFTFELAPYGDGADLAPLPANGTGAAANEESRVVTYAVSAPDSTGAATATLNTGDFIVTPAMMGGAAERTFTYVLRETTEAGGGLYNSTDVAVVTVACRDDGNGSLEASISHEGPTRFQSAYRVDSATYTLLRADKRLDGIALDPDTDLNHRFVFGITPDDEASAAKMGVPVVGFTYTTVMTAQRADATGWAHVALSYFSDVQFSQADVAALGWEEGGATRSRTYRYTVSEIAPTVVPDGYVYDGSVYDVAVKLADDGVGHLSVETTVTQVKDSSGADIEASDQAPVTTTCSRDGAQLGVVSFRNAYHSSAAVEVPAQKKLIGRHLTHEGFTFCLEPVQVEGAAPLSEDGLSALKASLLDSRYFDTARLMTPNQSERSSEWTSDEGLVSYANVPFPSVYFNTDDLPKLVEAGYGTVPEPNVYRMWFRAYESPDSFRLQQPDNSIRLVATDFRLCIELRDTGSGTLSPTIYDEDGNLVTSDSRLTFVNSYEPAYVALDGADARLRVTKALLGRTWDQGVDSGQVFSFTLTPSTDAGYAYRESATVPLPVVNEADAAYHANDPGHDSVTVSISAGGHTSGATPDVGTAPSFGIFKFTKADMVDAVEQGDRTQLKTFQYDVREVMPEDGTGDAEKNGISYDQNVQHLSITVRDDTVGHLSIVSASLSSREGDTGTTFANAFSAAAPFNDESNGTGTMQITASLEGHAMAVGDFSFKIEAQDDQSAALLSRAGYAPDQDGAVVIANVRAHEEGEVAGVDIFQNVVFRQDQSHDDLGKTFTFLVSEVQGDRSAFAYDDTVYKLELTPADANGDGAIEVDTTLYRKNGSGWDRLACDADGNLDVTAVQAPTWQGTASAKAHPFIPFTNRYAAEGSAYFRAEKQLFYHALSDSGAFNFSFSLQAGGAVLGAGTNAEGAYDGDSADVPATGAIAFEGAAAQKVAVALDGDGAVAGESAAGDAVAATKLRFVVDTTTADLLVGSSEPKAVNLVAETMAGDPAVAQAVFPKTVADNGTPDDPSDDYDVYHVTLTGQEDLSWLADKAAAGKAGVNPSKPSATVYIDLSDPDGDGVLQASVTYPNQQVQALFQNYYEPSGSRTVGVQGAVHLETNRADGIRDGEFAFTLSGEQGSTPPLPAGADGGAATAVNHGETVDFSTITFRSSDLLTGAVIPSADTRYKDFVYVVHQPVYAADDAEHQTDLNAAGTGYDDGKGRTYAADQKFIIRIHEDTSGGADSGELTMQRFIVLPDGAQDEAATSLSASNGRTYTVRELDGYSAIEMFDFLNTQQIGSVWSSPTDEGSGLSVSKRLEGRVLRSGGFQFALRGTGSTYSGQSWTAVNGVGDDPSAVSFDQIEFKRPGTYYFDLREDPTANPGGLDERALDALSFSTADYQLTARVVESDSEGMTVTWSATDATAGAASEPVSDLSFVNSYDAQANDARFVVTKVMEGRAQVAGGFTFTAVNPVSGKAWWTASNGDADDGVRQQVVEAFGEDGRRLVDRMTTAELDAALPEVSDLESADEQSRAYAATKAYSVYGGITRELWCVPVRVSESFDAAEHPGVSQYAGFDAALNETVAASYDATIVALDDTYGNVSVRVVPGVWTADDFNEQLLAAPTNGQLSGSTADAQLAAKGLPEARLTFVNRYDPDPAQPSAVSDLYNLTKVLEGRNLRAGEFTFSATLSDGSDADDVLVLENGRPAALPDDMAVHGSADADGFITFPQVSFAHAGTYEFILREDVQEGVGVTYGGERYRATATVQDTDAGGNVLPAGTVPQGKLAVSWVLQQLDSAGRVTRTVAPAADDSATSAQKLASFANSYEASTAADGGMPLRVSATKRMVGRPMAANDFRFDLKMHGEDFRGTLTAGAFGETAAVIGSTGTSRAQVVAQAGNAAQAQPGVAAQVVAAGGSAISVDYTLAELDQWARQRVATKQVDDATSLATYTLYYSLTENESASRMNGAKPVGTGSYRFKVQVSDNGDGTLAAGVVPGSIEPMDGSGEAQAGTTVAFANSYEPADSEALAIAFEKRLVGADSTSQTYAFELVPQDYQGATAPLHVSDGHGSHADAAEGKLSVSGVAAGSTGVFDALVFTADDLDGVSFQNGAAQRSKTFRYTLHEAYYDESGRDLNAAGTFVRDGVSYADDATIEVTVVDNPVASGGKLVASYRMIGSPADDGTTPVMVNAYGVNAAVDVAVPYGEAAQPGEDLPAGTLVGQVLTHRDLYAGDFSYSLYRVDDLDDAGWRTSASLASTGTNEAATMKFVEEANEQGVAEDKVTLLPTMGRVRFSDVTVTPAMMGYRSEADVYFKLVQDTAGASEGTGTQAGQKVRAGIALDEAVWDVRLHVADDGSGGLASSWSVKRADEGDDAWTDQAVFRSSYEAQGTGEVRVHSQLTGRSLHANGFYYYLHLGDGAYEGYDASAAGPFDQIKGNATVIGDALSPVNFESLPVSLADIHEEMAAGTLDVDAEPAKDADGNLQYNENGAVKVTYVIHLLVTELGSFDDPRAGGAHSWPVAVSPVHNVHNVDTFELDGVEVPGVFYTRDDAAGVSLPTYRVDMAVSDNGDGTLSVSSRYPQSYKADGTATDGQGRTFPVSAGDKLRWVEFNNAYEPSGATVDVAGSVTLTGRDLTAYPFGFNGESYAFKIRQIVAENGVESQVEPENWVAGTTGADGESVATSVPNADGKAGDIGFGVLAYTAADLEGCPATGRGGARTCTFVYEVTQTSSDGRGVTVDASAKRFTVTVRDGVTDDPDFPVLDGTVTATIAPATGAQSGKAFTFANSYRAAIAADGPSLPTGEGGLSVGKRMTGRLLQAGDFDYVMVDTAGRIVARGSNADDADDGLDGYAPIALSVTGTELDFSSAALANGDGTYASEKEMSYVLSEVNAGISGVEYDPTSYVLQATLADDGLGNLAVRWHLRNSDATAVVFEGTYDSATPASTPTTLFGRNLMRGRDILDTSRFEFALYYADDGSRVRDASGAVLPAVTTPRARDGVVTSRFEIARLGYTNKFLQQLVADGHATCAGQAPGVLSAQSTQPTVYTVRYVAAESADELARGVKATTEPVAITVTVADDNEGTLSVQSVEYASSGDEMDVDEGAAFFANEYNAEASADFQATEMLSGRSLQAGELAVNLRYPAPSADEDADPVVLLGADGEALVGEDGDPETLTGSANPSASPDGVSTDAFTFASLNYSSKSLKKLVEQNRATSSTAADGTVTYVVSYEAYEESLPRGITPAEGSSARAVQVRVTDYVNSLDRGMEAEVLYADAEGGLSPLPAAFANDYSVEPSDPFALEGTKRVFGVDAQEPDSPLVAQAGVGDEGGGDFVALQGVPVAMSAQAASRALEGGEFSFTARYAEGDEEHRGAVAFAGVNGPAAIGEAAPIRFESVRYAVDDSVEGAVDLSALIEAGAATLISEGVYEVPYVITEDELAEDSHMQPNTQEYHVTVRVVDDGVSGYLQTSVDYGTDAEGSQDSIGFVNRYESKTATLAVDALKRMQGDRALKAGDFSFTIEAVGDNAALAPLPDDTTVSNSSTGAVRFGNLTFGQECLDGATVATFTYRVHELAPDAEGVDRNTGDGTYESDGVTYAADRTFTVTVADDGEGAVTAVSSELSDGALVFTNEYHENEPAPSDDPTPEKPDDGDHSKGDAHGDGSGDSANGGTPQGPAHDNAASGGASSRVRPASTPVTGDALPVAPLAIAALAAMGAAALAARALRRNGGA